MSVSHWYPNSDRWPLMDFTFAYAEREVLVLTPRPAAIDFNLFARPFTSGAWWGIILVTALGSLMVLLLGQSIPYLEATVGFKLAVLSLLGFFVLLNAFYSGALTMFFANEIKVQLNVLLD